MYLFYNWDSIIALSIFSSFDFTLFTEFEKVMVVIGFNIFVLLFLCFIFTLIYKAYNRLASLLF